MAQCARLMQRQNNKTKGNPQMEKAIVGKSLLAVARMAGTSTLAQEKSQA